MLLNLSERFVLLSILPGHANSSNQRIIDRVYEALYPSEEEYEECGIKQAGETKRDGSIVPDGQIAWDLNANVPKEIPIGEKGQDVLKRAFRKLDQQEQLSRDLLRLCDRLFPGLFPEE
jgi:hypothetical protein